MKLPFWLAKIISIVKATPLVGGLEISDSALRFAVRRDEVWHTVVVRLAPGILVGGEIKNAHAFLDGLRTLHADIAGKGSIATVNVVVTLSSLSIYSQVFTLPFIEEDRLEQAILLNMQMVSPAAFKETHSGWQVVYHDEDKATIDVLGAFINKTIADPIIAALEEAQFLPVALEPKALSLVRLNEQSLAGLEKEKTYIMLFVSTDGVSFLVVRHGFLYFDYFNAWREIQEPGTQISLQDFERIMVRSLHQVLNFYHSHWQEPITELLILTTGLEDEIATMVRNNFPLTVRKVVLEIPGALGFDWYAALGCGLRGAMPRSADQDVSLLGIDARREFEREQILSFTRFWRTMTPVAFVLVLMALIVADIYLLGIRRNLEMQNVKPNAEQMAEIKALEQKAQEFNRNVAFLTSAETSASFKTPILQKIQALAGQANITIERASFQSASGPLTLSAIAISEDSIITFKKLLETDGMFTAITLPLTGIQSTPQGLTFSISFSLSS